MWTTTGDTSLAVSPERINAAPKIWTGTSLFPASQYPARAAKTGSVVRITAAGRGDPLSYEGLYPERPGRRYQTRHDEGEPDLPRRQSYGLEEGQSSPKASAIESI